MGPYAFETPEFGLNEHGLSRLRSRFVFETIAYPEIAEAKVTRGKSVHNWILLLVVGMLCLVFSAFTGYNLFQFLTSGKGGHIYVEEIATPFLPACIGVAAIWQALKVMDILVVRVGRRRLVFPLDKLKANKSLMELESFLSKQVGRRY